jgi:hypothetical protein
MIPMVPALATACTAQRSAWLGGQIDRLRTDLLADLERIDPGAATGIWADLAWDIDMGDYPSEETR